VNSISVNIGISLIKEFAVIDVLKYVVASQSGLRNLIHSKIQLRGLTLALILAQQCHRVPVMEQHNVPRENMHLTWGLRGFDTILIWGWISPGRRILPNYLSGPRLIKL